MSESLKVSAGENGTHVANIDEFYVCRINWLITIGRTDLIDEIADDCERRRNVAHNPTAAVRPAAGDAGVPPRPVETGTRLAAARLRRVHRQATR